MEVDLEPRVKPLSYKVKGISRESPAQKAANVLDNDLRNHWSTGTNTKEWILLELDEPCLLSHIRIYNKSVLEWEISVGLRYKPETFIKVRPRCEAPRRDMVYPMNYSPCRYVRISCLRGNPIAIFFIQLIGVSVTGLEPEFQPVVNHLLPHIISQKQDTHDMHLQLLQDITNRLVAFLPQLEVDLNSFSEAAEPTLRFLAMLSGPFYPILRIVNERETTKISGNLPDSEASKNGQLSVAFTVSSNFEPRRLRNASVSLLPISSELIFRPDVVFTLLRKAYKDPNLGKVCRMVSSILLKLTEAVEQEVSSPDTNVTPDEASKSEPSGPFPFVDYSNLFGEEFLIPDGNWETSYLNILDTKLVEEGLLHVLYASASQHLLCSKLADSYSDLWLALPLIQALVPALRPSVSSPDQIDENFSQWKQPLVQHALSEIVSTSSSVVFRPLLRACAGYLSSFSPSHAKAACVLIDLCSGVLAPWLAQVIAKVDLAVELLEDLFGDIQGARSSFAHSRAALKYIVLALSGNMDDVMAKYKDVKHQILFLVEMLEPFLDPAMTPVKSIISFGNVSSTFFEKQEQNCAIALNVLRTAVSKPAVLPSLEAEWWRGSVSPSILLSILEPHMQLPPDIDLRKYSTSRMEEIQSSVISSQSSAPRNGGSFSKSNSEEDAEGRTDNSDVPGKMDFPEEASFLFAPSELSTVSLTYVSGSQNGKNFEINHSNVSMKGNDDEPKISVNHLCENFTPNSISTPGYSDLMADYFQLKNYSDSELKASEFRRFALDLHSQTPLTPEGHSAAIDALLLAAECHVNPFFMMSFQDTSQAFIKENVSRSFSNWKLTDIRKVLEKNDSNLKLVADLERERDKAVLEILLEAAELDRKYQKISLDTELAVSYAEENEEVVKLSQDDVLSADAITLVRQNQKLLCNFLIQQLQRDQQSMHEILLQSLLFLLHSATKLFCAPELVVDIILKSAEYFNVLLKSLYYQFKEGSLQLSHLKLHEVQRRWMLLQRLVIASSGSDEESNISVNVHNGFRFANLIPPSAWLQKISKFASSSFPLVRYLGWMAVSRNAKQYLKERLFLASDLTQLTFLLSIFSDELALVDNIVKKEDEKKKGEEPRVKEDVRIGEGFEHPRQQYDDQSFTAIYPDICQFFPNLKEHFESFGESILEAVGLQLKSLSSAIVPDLMCWFSDLCLCPFLQKRKDLKGFAAKNAKAVIRFILESVLSVHMEAMVPEIPRLVQVLASLCSSSYSDVSFLDSILHLLKPLFSYSLHKAFKEENLSSDYPCLNFESLCFNELLGDLKDSGDGQGHAKEYGHRKALIVFVLASVLPDLSFHCKTEILQSSLSCADFASYEATTSFHDYLCAYQMLMGSCKSLLVQLMRDCGAIPVKKSLDSDANIAACDDCFQSCSWFLLDVCHSVTEVSEKLDSNNGSTIHMSEKVCPFSTEEIENFLKELDDLIDKLNPTVDLCYKVHHKLARKLTLTSAECFIYSKFLSSIEKNLVLAGIEKENLLQSNFVDQFLTCWNFGLEEFAEKLLVLQEKHCWEATSVFLDCLLSMPQFFCLDSVINKICSAIKNFSCNAPNISWRLQTDRWMSSLLRRGVHLLHRNETPFVDLLCSMLKHPEPEQRFIAVKHLRRLVSHEVEGETTLLSLNSELAPSAVTISSSLSISSTLVCSTWDQVVYLASSDTSLLLRTHSMALLLNYIPLAGRQKLQSLLAAADSILQSLTNLVQPTCEGPIPKFSLALLANICLHTPAEDISLIPDIIWSSIESFGMLENERCPVGPERKVCKALCRLRAEEDEAKQMLREVLSSSSSEPPNPDFGSTRESILQVISNFTSVQSYFDLFSKETDKKALELEEAEIEMELLQKEHDLQDSSNNIKDLSQLPFLADGVRDDNRLQQIKDGIRSLEKTKLREEIIARRQKKTLLRRARQKFLEDAALQEAEHLQELDRERTSEVEREIERQRLVELERAKTREMQHNLDMEREKQAQRELQRELEHVESGGGTRASRREYPSSSHSRSRYRERENGRASNEIRASGGGAQPDTGMSSSPIAAVPKVVLSGGRQFSGQVPTILQSQERSDEYGSGYEENFDGSKDSGDTGSVGDPDVVSAFEGQSLAFSSTLRHGSRGSKSRQILERKERDRRESKWERKH